MIPAVPVWRDGLLEGRVVLVAGAGGDEGCDAGDGIAARLAALGARVERAPPCDAPAADALLADLFGRHGALATLITLATDVPVVDEDPVRFDAAAWRAGVDRTLNSSWYLMQAAARHWRDRGQPGQVVAVLPPYRADKRGDSGLACAVGASLAHLVKTVAVEWAEFRIRVNGVAPVQPRAPALAEAVVWLCADSGKFVTGEILNLSAPA